MKLTEQEWGRVQRYVAGSASPEEARWVEQKMRQESVFHSLVTDLKTIWSWTPEEDFFVDLDMAWETFRLRNRYRPYLKPLHHREAHSRPRTRTVYRWMKAAAVVLVGVVAGYLINDRMAQEPTEAEVVSTFNRMQEMSTDRGEKAKVTFSDGSTVILNSSSRLRFPDHFNEAYREVYLEGEAFFSVSHSADRPFVVHTGEIDVEVLGTSFNVRHWEEDHRSEVAVRDGRVSVRSTTDGADQDAREAVILEANQMTSVRQGEQPEDVETVDIEKFLLWTAGGLYFRNTPFDQVMRDLERRFDLSIQLEGLNPAGETLTATFYDADLNEILSVIATAMRAEVEREGSVVTFRHLNGPVE